MDWRFDLNRVQAVHDRLDRASAEAWREDAEQRAKRIDYLLARAERLLDRAWRFGRAA